MDCLTCRGLAEDYVTGVLSAQQRAAVDGHLAGCPACALDFEAVRQIEELLDEQRLQTPALDFTQRAIAQTRVEEAPVFAASWRVQALAYTVSLVSVLFGFYRWFGETPASGAIRTPDLAWQFLFAGTDLPGADERRGWMESLRSAVEVFEGPEAGAVLLLLGLTWVIYLMFKDQEWSI